MVLTFPVRIYVSFVGLIPSAFSHYLPFVLLASLLLFHNMYRLFMVLIFMKLSDQITKQYGRCQPHMLQFILGYCGSLGLPVKVQTSFNFLKTVS